MRNELFSTPKIDYLSNLLLAICVISFGELKPKQINANTSHNDLGKMFCENNLMKVLSFDIETGLLEFIIILMLETIVFLYNLYPTILKSASRPVLPGGRSQRGP